MKSKEVFLLLNQTEDLGHVVEEQPHKWLFTPEELVRFAQLIAEAEREACAKVCEVSPEFEDWEIQCGAEGRQLLNDMAAAIRARGQQ